ncbi:hypothetical protein CXF85_04595 [Colwellia sp. 75C3]|uniref:phosphotransferase n=1 Tax=Colwellia sp. 75C3 TaxID=888425 RepID=UPI000C335529|nr:phosphotransferase [Colwellia sp. 75C3]PKG84894.1 hypothetical protein CXF85_04595 [Colwellia sp. 75C3]
MTLIQSDLNSLKSLPCFNGIVEVRLLTDGMSHTCVKVITVEQDFLAKKLNKDTANTEVFSALTCSASGLSPTVIYHDTEWLVTVFITGTSLAKSELQSSSQISTALTLMARIHLLEPPQNNQSFPTLDTAKSVNRLFTNPASFNKHERLNLISVTETLTNDINAQIAHCDIPNVVCHGDLNFTNILIDNSQNPWLIDFECTHLAPVEFDLAMFTAVNNILPNQLSKVVSVYSTLAPSYRVDYKLLNYYVLYSYFINGLWYLDNINDPKADCDFRTLAIEQWSAFDSYAIKQVVDFPKLLPIIY